MVENQDMVVTRILVVIWGGKLPASKKPCTLQDNQPVRLEALLLGRACIWGQSPPEAIPVFGPSCGAGREKCHHA